MKRTKQISIWIIALAGLMIATGAVQAQQNNFKHNGLYYKVTKKTGVISYEVKVVPEKALGPFPLYSAGNEPTGAVTIPKNFSRKEGLLTYHNTVTEIGDNAFNGCGGITSVTIPNSVKTIGKGAFRDCYALKSVNLPDGIQEIGGWAFKKCTALHSIDIPGSVKTIGERAFDYCTALQSIDIPASVKTIGWAAFRDCYALKSVTLPNGIQEIGMSVFRGCTALQSIDIPAGVKTIENWAFEKCTGLKTVTVHWNTPLKVPDNVFENVNTDNVTLKVPKGKEAAYKVHDVWGKFKFEGGSTPPPPPPAIQVTSVTLSHHEVTVNGDITQKQLTATVQPATATNKSLTWKSSNAAVASVDADGLVTIHKKGKATVTATANDGSGQSDACLFDVISTVANETVDGLRIFAADGALRLTLPSPETVHIYHVNGAMVKTLVLPAGDHVQPLPSGVYLVRVGESVTKILIK